MKKTIKLLVMILMVLSICGCQKEKYVSFTYKDNKYSNRKCKIENKKIKCNVIEPEKDNSVFVGWYDDNNKKIDINGEFTQSTSLHPKFLSSDELKEEKISENKYTIRFDLNGGEGTFSELKAEYEEKLPNLNSIPKKDEYIFLGFYDNKDYEIGKQYYNSKGENVRNFDKVNDTTLYAAWKKDSYTIKFDANGGIVSNIDSVKIHSNEDMPSIDETPYKLGYTFMGWYDNSDWTKGVEYYNNENEKVKKYEEQEDIILYARWEKTKEKVEIYTITYNSNGGIGNVNSQSVNSGSNVTIAKNTFTRDGYTFKGWNTKANGEGIQYNENSNIKPTNSLTLYAMWDANVYVITLNNEGANTSGTTRVYYKYSKRQIIDTHHTFYFEDSALTKPIGDGIYDQNGYNGVYIDIPTKKGYEYIGYYTEPNAKGTKYVAQNGFITPWVSKNVYKNITLYAFWKNSSYIVSFNVNGGTGQKPSDVNATYGKAMPVIEKNIPTRKGYTFMGWYDNSDYTKGIQYYTNENKVKRAFDKTNSLTLYAGWKKEATTNNNVTYTITYNSNGGTGSMNPQSIIAGNSINILANTFKRNGYTFVRWNTLSTGTGTAYNANARIKPTSSLTLYAIWNANKYIVTLNNAGATMSGTTKVCYQYNTPKTINGHPTYFFEDNALTKPINNGKYNTSNNNNGIYITPPIKTGYKFEGYYTEPNGGGSKYVDKSGYITSWIVKNITKNTTLYAKWEKNVAETYQVAFNLNGGGGTKPSNVNAAYGKTMPEITQTPPAKKGYRFVGWYDSRDKTKGIQYYTNENKSTKKYDKKQNITLYAIWEANAFIVEYNSNGGTGTVKSQTCTYDRDCKLSNNGYSKKGYAFIGWKKNNQGDLIAPTTNVKNVIASGKITYYAQWKTSEYKITYNLNGGTGETPKETIATYGKDMPAITTKIPTKNGFIFKGWYDNSNYTKGAQYYTNENKTYQKYNKYANTTLYAGWQAKTYKVTYNLNGGTGETPAQVNITYGKAMPKIPTTPPTRNGFIFKGWYDNSDWTKGIKYNNPDGTSAKPYNKYKNITLYAGWEKQGANLIKIVYDCNGGTGAPSTEEVKINSLFTPKASRCQKNGYIFDGWYDADGTDWTLKTADLKDGKNGVKNNTLTLKAKWTPALKSNNTAIKPNKNEISYSYESSTLKYYISQKSKYKVTHIWVQDPYNQFRMAISQENKNAPANKKSNNPNNSMIVYEVRGQTIISNEIETKGYSNKGLVGTNGSGMISSVWAKDAPLGWRGQPQINLWVVNGKIIRYDYQTHPFTNYIYGLGKDNQLRAFYTNFGTGKTATKNGNELIKEYVTDVYKIKNTFSFLYPGVLVKNGTSQYNPSQLSDHNKKTWTDANVRQALCQIDQNNFVFITSTTGTSTEERKKGLSYKNVADIMLDLGCKTGFSLDGGGSTSHYYKSNTNKLNGPGKAYDGRILSDIIYFVEK